MIKYHFRRNMKNIIICLVVGLLLGCMVKLQTRSVFKELENLNSKIDKMIIFLDLDLNAQEEIDA